MKFIFLISAIFFLANCSKPKTVLICGDHACINKAEAEQFFEENLTIEVKILDKKMKKNTDLVELNLQNNSNELKSVSIKSIENKNKRLKILSKDEISKIKKKIKDKNNNEKYASRKTVDKKPVKNIKINEKKINNKKKELSSNNVNNNKIDVADICIILEKCSIDEISKYLLKIGKNKDFPDITKRQLN
ncbi:hypothetical protein OAM06_01050 [Pelagibacteraceae bacterium]|nr:hypothetical protein [Pelagibacteraceae bacterium]